MRKITKILDVEAGALKELINMDIGDLREKLAWEDADDTVEDFLAKLQYDEDENEVREDELEFEDIEEYEEDDAYWDEDEDDEPDTELPSEEENLAHQVAEDITDGKYSIDTISGLYSGEFIQRVRELL